VRGREPVREVRSPGERGLDPCCPRGRSGRGQSVPARWEWEPARDLSVRALAPDRLEPGPWASEPDRSEQALAWG
jgi:hypothetical protein